MRVGWERKTSLAARQRDVISVFFRQTDFETFAEYPTSRRRAIMSSISRDRMAFLDDVSGMEIEGVRPPVEVEVERIVCGRGISSGGGRGRPSEWTLGDADGEFPRPPIC